MQSDQESYLFTIQQVLLDNLIFVEYGVRFKDEKNPDYIWYS